MWDSVVSFLAPCQCFSPALMCTTSPTVMYLAGRTTRGYRTLKPLAPSVYPDFTQEWVERGRTSAQMCSPPGSWSDTTGQCSECGTAHDDRADHALVS